VVPPATPIATPTPVVTASASVEPSPTARSGFLGTNLSIEYGYAIVAVLVIAVVAGLSLAYLKRLGKTKS